MKWAVPELRRLNKPVIFDETLDLSNDIVGFNGVKNMSMVHISGSGYEFIDNQFRFKFDITCDLVLTCAVSLEDIEYKLEVQAEEIFSYNDEEDEDVNLIIGQTIDLTPTIISNIILNIPMRVVKEGLEVTYDTEEEEIVNDGPFASLAEYFKK